MCVFILVNFNHHHHANTLLCSKCTIPNVYKVWSLHPYGLDVKHQMLQDITA